MKSALLSFCIVFSLVSQAQQTTTSRAGFGRDQLKSGPDLRLNLFLPGAQMRYQDTSSQSQELVTHYTYTISGQFDRLLLGLEYLTLDENNGNQSFKIERTFSEQNLFFGYTAFKRGFLVSGKFLLEFMLTPEIILGRSNSIINTQLLGESQKDVSSEESSYGLGLIGSVRTGYLLVETDFRHQTSKNYEPGSLMLGTVRVGANFQF